MHLSLAMGQIDQVHAVGRQYNINVYRALGQDVLDGQKQLLNIFSLKRGNAQTIRNVPLEIIDMSGLTKLQQGYVYFGGPALSGPGTDELDVK